MPTKVRWDVPSELSPQEQRVAKSLSRIGKFYVFLRQVRQELFDEAFQAELAQAYDPKGRSPLPPAMLAMVTLLQAYDQTGDAEAVVTAEMDKRWQLVLGCLGAEKAPFSQGVLSQFRERMIAHDLDVKLVDRSVELAKKTGLFGWQALRAALDSSPLLGAGRVLDTWNLIGRALSTVVDCAAKVTQVPREQICREAKLTVLAAPSIKSALDIDWDDPAQKDQALARLLGETDALQAWVAAHAGTQVEESPLREALEALRRVLEQDIEPDPTTGRHRIRRGVARDRMPSLGDKEMRHGRKNKTRPFNGFKRHFLTLLEPKMIVAATVLPANDAEHVALAPLVAHVGKHGRLEEMLMDRGYLASDEIPTLRATGVKVRCKAWRASNGDRFPKQAFEIDMRQRTVTCPAGETVRFKTGPSVVRFPAATCLACPKRAECTMSKRGRTIAIHPQEELLVELRAAVKTAAGRAALRERTPIEHTLAAVQQLQGSRARYRGVRKNSLDARRTATLLNLQELARLQRAA